MKVSIPRGGHAQKRMEERGISQEDVEGIINHAELSWHSSKGTSRVYSGTTPNGRVIRVVVLDPPLSDGTVIVKTAYDPNQEDSI